MLLYTNRIIEVCNHIHYIMKIIKVYRFICILLITFLSGIVLHSLNSFDTILHISLYSRNEYLSRTNGRYLAEGHHSRETLKRPYSCELTEDELLGLFQIIHVETVIASDIITAMILRLDEENNRLDVEELVRNTVFRRLRREMPHSAAELRLTMEARLMELVHEIMTITPLSKDILLHQLEIYRVELDESVEILRFIAKQNTEEGIYEFLNNLALIRESLEILLKSNDIVVCEHTSTIMVLRIRRRVLDILHFHRENTLNRIKEDDGMPTYLGSYRLLGESQEHFDGIFDLYKKKFLHRMGYSEEDSERIKTAVKSHVDLTEGMNIDRRRKEKLKDCEHIIKRCSSNSISKFSNNFKVLSSPYFLAICSFILYSNGYHRVFFFSSNRHIDF
ncbi:conserved Plasmodium protein, unknown function [Plasmodium knowlesi strain H]|uniref:Uncharacterized protein n=3 Tax=Plasmodium knowlesi TaxID=5850 RepID=A0A5K1U248_PLAKH|nr:conserved Plasmodium protein, unknown function [Plasmodium knowlesi strain H]OTN67656.1 Uncharacterized protein PKNOH_S05400200 [Plasmodium knowlesi]CAA9990589.1 conserved Plasmodium protein, unknown function [Plasmodium knowlesi strain H]SBO19865.1 conserved Plasmodium protein, unknown function [Plasmodium knowlesi strain H]SBO22292.1 conserved Plasmodium protein, unknown function [Plasmodium knowlesi strain H]VVS80063.1 conserved Plasmodium protein, unknown function [Plasmodium knowlesi s|eukprot:XP_002260973.1 hypothetical protein, conserved in Plasmodium species [Plasmodium knowlesi strain H]